jgi:hypothetical protein
MSRDPIADVVIPTFFCVEDLPCITMSSRRSDFVGAT